MMRMLFNSAMFARTKGFDSRKIFYGLVLQQGTTTRLSTYIQRQIGTSQADFVPHTARTSNIINIISTQPNLATARSHCVISRVMQCLYRLHIYLLPWPQHVGRMYVAHFIHHAQIKHEDNVSQLVYTTKPRNSKSCFPYVIYGLPLINQKPNAKVYCRLPSLVEVLNRITRHHPQGNDMHPSIDGTG